MTGEAAPWIVSEDGGAVRKHAPATLRNREPIADVLPGVLPGTGRVLEVASGSGEHCSFFAQRFETCEWQPSDPDPQALASIKSWCAERNNALPPVALDAADTVWPVARADAIVCINMTHIAPWQATLGLMAGAGRLLTSEAPLYLYGPFVRDGVTTAESNRAFDASLRARDSRWGLRRVEDISAAAGANALHLERVIEMPANNLSLVYRRA
ncbi:DUF938 domain-containing protein [Stakelama sp. CBK3Z-3]|uniref:DUF938 domain-containing protein n=1 Tax=Stakelama flava TaxID=2860338 RepID=A0ABS6XMN8_9SPHN|nr:DUF938 domain-containing protein [Stakelama flava]MBW4331478.1 DUF938 domain-containing protein [Stakelama flava]